MSEQEWATFLTGIVFGVGLAWLTDVVCRAAFGLYEWIRKPSTKQSAKRLK